jgi:uncharacterized membrane protein
VAVKYGDLIFSLVLFLRQKGLTFLTVKMVNIFLALIILFIMYKMFELAKTAVIYVIILLIILVPVLFLTVSSFFYGGSNLDTLVK